MSADPCPARSQHGFDLVEEELSLNRYTRAGISHPFVVLPGVYQPDEWTGIALESAISALDMMPTAVRIHDIGTGSGVIPLLLTRLYPGRAFRFVCSDLKPASGHNLALNYEVFGGTNPRPRFHRFDIRRAETLPADDGPPELVIANIPQLPAARGAETDWNPDDYHAVAPADRNDPVRAFGLGLLMDVAALTRAGHTGPFHMAFCRSSRIPPAVFDMFLSAIRGTIVTQGRRQRVKDGSTPFATMADAEDRFGLYGEYEWQGKALPARDLRGLSPVEDEIFIGLRSCLVRID